MSKNFKIHYWMFVKIIGNYNQNCTLKKKYNKSIIKLI